MSQYNWRRVDILDQVEVTYNQLLKKVEIVMLDIHAEISALEQKIDDDLLESLDENLQIAALQNRVDAFNSEYANVINTFYDLSRDELVDVDLLVDKEKAAYAELIEIYDERVALYNEVEDMYEQILAVWSAWSSWENQDLFDVVNGLEVYYRSQFIAAWKVNIATHIPSTNASFKDDELDNSLQAFANSFAVKADSSLWWLYNIDTIKWLNQRILSLRAAYLQQNGSFDCQAFASNVSIETTATNLIDDMDELLWALQWTNQSLNWSAADLLAASLDQEGEWFIDVLIEQEKTRIQSQAERTWSRRLAVPSTTQSLRRQRTVRNFLQAQYKASFDAWRLPSFVRKLENANERINDIVDEKNPQWTTKDMLDAIQTVIEEFLE